MEAYVRRLEYEIDWPGQPEASRRKGAGERPFRPGTGHTADIRAPESSTSALLTWSDLLAPS